MGTRVKAIAWIIAAGAVAGAAYLLQPRPQVERTAAAAAPAAPTYGFEVVHDYPHDPQAFTQGLIFRDGVLYESTGLSGRSSLRKVKLETGEVLQKKDIAKDYFAEGLTDWNGQLLQLTWVSHVGFIYDPATFEQKRQFNYGGEGWGLTHDGRRLIMSDGTANLRWIDPDSLQELSRFTVRDGGQTIPNLNELEYVKGSIYANVWMTDRIAVIAPDSGNVTGWIDLTNLRAPAARQGDVLNGIAYDAAADRLFVTGKLWPRLYEIRLRSR